MIQVEKVEALSIQLHGMPVAVLSHYAGGKNILVFHPEFLALPVFERPIFTLRQKFDADYLTQVQIRTEKIPPVLSNLLPEGILREWVAQSLKCHITHEFAILAYLGSNLPGAIVAKPIPAGQVPRWALEHRLNIEPLSIDVQHVSQKFSLAGVQMKFSSSRKDHRFLINQELSEDIWIVKTPSTLHKGLTVNEFSCMHLAQAAGANTPDIQLVELENLEGLPDMVLPDEKWAYAIKRFDRSSLGRVHMEDFAQVFGLYPSDKYQKVNYEQLASVVYRTSDQRLADIQQLARRLLINVLLANGDAHLKNWSMMYVNQTSPRLSPLYDVVFTSPYIHNDQAALNLAGNKQWSKFNWMAFEQWAVKANLPWQAIKPHLLATLTIAQQQWPNLLATLPMLEEHKQQLRHHWQQLHSDFRFD